MVCSMVLSPGCCRRCTNHSAPRTVGSFLLIALSRAHRPWPEAGWTAVHLLQRGPLDLGKSIPRREAADTRKRKGVS
jgi:hypothetical protein